jgi:uncharacterized protein YfaT (DUF1175 family)
MLTYSGVVRFLCALIIIQYESHKIERSISEARHPTDVELIG